MIKNIKQFVEWTLTEPGVNSRMLYAFTSTILGVCLLYLVGWLPFLKDRTELGTVIGLIIGGFLAVSTGRYLTAKGTQMPQIPEISNSDSTSTTTTTTSSSSEQK